MNIDKISFDKEIGFAAGVTFDQIPGAWPIETNTIVYKFTCGIGATHGEIIAPRDSIIVFPHISVIDSKHKKHKDKDNTFAVHGDVSEDDVFNYLLSNIEYKKLLTTPAGLIKIINATNRTDRDYRDTFFILIDECHKLIKDANYRSDLLKAMDLFFLFENKAMVSATPLVPTDPRFKKHNFKYVKIYPLKKEKIDINVLNSNSVLSELEKYIGDHPSKHYCIFFNTIAGILNVIDQLDIAEDCIIHCSEKSRKLLELDGKIYAQSVLSTFKKYNFFTSSFFNGLDIILPGESPEVILISDCGYKKYSILDPYTDVYQIVGRFRGNYKSVVHINHSNTRLNPPSTQEANEKLSNSEEAYKHMHTLKFSTIGRKLDNTVDQILRTLRPYYNILGENGKPSSYLKDNYLDDIRIQHYYKRGSALISAYEDTQRYNLKHKDYRFGRDEIIRLTHRNVRYKAKTNRLIASLLASLEDIAGTQEYFNELAQIKNISELIYKAYFTLGLEALESLRFNKKKIELALLKHEIDAKLNQFPVVDVINKTFKLNIRYTIERIEEELTKIFTVLGVELKAKAYLIKKYFYVKDAYKHVGNNTVRCYILTDYKLNPVSIKQD